MQASHIYINQILADQKDAESREQLSWTHYYMCIIRSVRPDYAFWYQNLVIHEDDPQSGSSAFLKALCFSVSS